MCRSGKADYERRGSRTSVVLVEKVEDNLAEISQGPSSRVPQYQADRGKKEENRVRWA